MQCDFAGFLSGVGRKGGNRDGGGADRKSATNGEQKNRTAHTKLDSQSPSPPVERYETKSKSNIANLLWQRRREREREMKRGS